MTRRYAMKHRCLVCIGILASIVQGAILPLYGVFLSKMLFVLNHPDKIIIPQAEGIPSVTQLYDKKGESDFWCIMMLIAAVSAFIASFLKRFCFGIVGEAVTY